MRRLKHEGNAQYLARAQHLVLREIIDLNGGEMVIPCTYLMYFLLYRAGLSLAEIAELAEVGRQHIAKRIVMVMAICAHQPTRAQIEALIAEMGRARWHSDEAQIVAFPGPSRLSQITVERSVV